LIFGGEQERGYRAGTEAIHNIAGLEEALKLSYNNLGEEKAYVRGIKSYFIKKLKEEFPSVTFNGASDNFEKSTYTLINVCLPINPEKEVLAKVELIKGLMYYLKFYVTRICENHL